MQHSLKTLTYAFHVLTHPFDGFYDLKHEKRGSLQAAVIIYVLVGITTVMRKLFSEYLFNVDAKNGVNIAAVFLLATLPYLLWCISNWCFTSLMDGEGSMKDMAIATGYALTPLIFSNLLYLILSWILIQEESTYIYFIQTFGMIWALCWVFFAMMITQQYTFGKSLGTAVLTIIGMGLILFIILLLFYLIQQVYTFFIDLYVEIEFRYNL